MALHDADVKTCEPIRRRIRILDILADETSLSAAQIRERLRPPVSERTLYVDLDWLAARFPEQISRDRGGDAREVYWKLTGLPPVLLPAAIATLTHDELAALIAARGLLRAPEARNPGWERPATAYAGDLSAALHGLLERGGLVDEARAMAPGAIGVSRFGVPSEATGAFATLVRILRTRQAGRFCYRSRNAPERDQHVWPIRLVLIKGEWHCFAWAPGSGTKPGRVKQYALSRITSRSPAVHIERHLPPGAPASPPHAEVDAILATGFHATGGGKRVRVVLSVSPEAWPFIVDRTWGEGQTIADGLPDLPSGWRRLEFSTTGLDECRHWVLSFGASMRAEKPSELRAWLSAQAKALLLTLGSDLTPVAAGTDAVIVSRMPDMAPDA